MLKEYILSFLPEQFLAPEEFFIEMAGITFPFPTYHVDRPNSGVFCLEYVLAGEGTLYVDEKSYEVAKGDCYLLPAGYHHNYWSHEKNPLHKIWVNVAGTVPQHLIAAYQLEQQVVFKKTDLFPLFNRLLISCEKKGLSPEKRSRTTTLLFHELLLALAKSPATLPSSVPQNLLQAKIFLENHLKEPQISVLQAAKQANLSSSQFTRQFKKYFQQTPYDYFLTKKLALAKLLLSETSLTIQEIAAELGFSDEHYFSNLFCKKIGHAPSKWRLEKKKLKKP